MTFNDNSLYKNLTKILRGPVRGGSEGSIDPPIVLENIIKEVKIELLS